MPKREFHPPHIYEDNACYFLTASTAHHRHYLSTDHHRDLVRDILKAAIQDYNVTLYGWVILADHYHLLLRTGHNIPLYKFIKRLHGESAIQLNRFDRTPGRRVWHQYWDRFPRSERDFWFYLNYIHLNPVKHGYVKVPPGAIWADGRHKVMGPDCLAGLHECLAQYPYSSYHYYVREFGREFLDDAWMRYPVPVDFDHDDFPEVQESAIVLPDAEELDRGLDPLMTGQGGEP